MKDIKISIDDIIKKVVLPIITALLLGIGGMIWKMYNVVSVQIPLLSQQVAQLQNELSNDEILLRKFLEPKK
jgi:predicted negative regulator of RcsB-dependent stress response